MRAELAKLRSRPYFSRDGVALDGRKSQTAEKLLRIGSEKEHTPHLHCACAAQNFVAQNTRDASSAPRRLHRHGAQERTRAEHFKPRRAAQLGTGACHHKESIGPYILGRQMAGVEERFDLRERARTANRDTRRWRRAFGFHLAQQAALAGSAVAALRVSLPYSGTL
ncbi:MAG TPA: hypothetical protein VFA72_17935, partial [Burkholderiales bacterium]|nr:hypothetical protein [Burkholderiales bacterium]